VKVKIRFIWLRNSPVAGYGNVPSGSVRVYRTTVSRTKFMAEITIQYEKYSLIQTLN